MRDSEVRTRTHIVQRVSIDPWRASLFRALAILLYGIIERKEYPCAVRTRIPGTFWAQ